MRFTRQHWLSLDPEQRIAWEQGKHGNFRVLAADAPSVQCVRVYGNGSRVVEQRTEENVQEWVVYNRTYRPGNALFVAGKLVDAGIAGHSPEYLAGIERHLQGR